MHVTLHNDTTNQPHAVQVTDPKHPHPPAISKEEAERVYGPGTTVRFRWVCECVCVFGGGGEMGCGCVDGEVEKKKCAKDGCGCVSCVVRCIMRVLCADMVVVPLLW